MGPMWADMAGQGKRRARACALLSAAAALSWLLWGVPATKPPTGLESRQSGLKYILLWNEYFDFENLGLGAGHGQEPFVGAGCPRSDCFMTADRSLLPPEEFDAVVFHMYYFTIRFIPLLNWGKLPSRRSPHQRYVFFLLESPVNSGSSYSGMDHLFNWTMTYRLDSDVVASYGEVTRREAEAGAGAGAKTGRWMQPPLLPIPPAAAAAAAAAGTSEGDRSSGAGGGRGPALAAWLVSHCSTQSLREEYVARLSMHMAVDVYGGCGTPWPKGDLEGFYAMLARKYKFYLAFENSLCRDYVTEKLFNILKLNVVPVVYGGANYSAVAPPYSYIDARAFASPSHLAQYLQYLSNHPKEYAKFFWWKKYYKVKPHPRSALCHLCNKLHESLLPKTYADMEEWWGEGSCADPDSTLGDFGG